jgi:ribonuclease HI
MKILAHFDGACEPTNPDGNMGMGVHIVDDEGNILLEYSEYILAKVGNTNNVAEYLALKEALSFLSQKKYKDCEIICKGDSMLAIKQMNGLWQIHKGEYKPHAEECKELIKLFSNIKFEHVKRELNTIADNLSKKKLLEHINANS